MDILKQLFSEKAQALAKEVKEMLAEHGNTKIDDVALEQAYGGMRDITSMIWEPSLLDAEEGILGAGKEGHPHTHRHVRDDREEQSRRKRPADQTGSHHR